LEQYEKEETITLTERNPYLINIDERLENEYSEEEDIIIPFT
jgi:hypothetical protein